VTGERFETGIDLISGSRSAAVAGHSPKKIPANERKESYSSATQF
jgi:hypothetical protein